MKTGMKFQNLQISESLNINPNKFSRLKFQPFKIMHISWRYNSAVSRFGYLYWVNQIFSLTSAFVFFINWWCFSEVWKKKDKFITIKIYGKISSLLPSILGQTAGSIRPTYIYVGIGVLLLHFQKSALRENYNTNAKM